MNKIDFTRNKLEPIILDLADLNGFDDPTIYLNELLENVLKFEDYDFTFSFYMNIKTLCNKHADKFWNDTHKRKIIDWLKGSGIISETFDKTFDNSSNISEPPPENIIGFNTTLQNQQIDQLYDELMKASYIKTTPEDFRALFTNKAKTIQWLESNALLAFFVSDLFQKNNSENYWNIAESIFVKRNGEKFNSLRQSFNNAYNINANNKPKGYQELNTIYIHLL